MRGLLLVGAIVAITAACSDPEDSSTNNISSAVEPPPAASPAGGAASLGSTDVARFHDLYGRQEFTDLFAGAADAITVIDTVPVDIQLMEGVHRRFGAVRATQRRESRVIATQGRRFLLIRQDTQFERGEAQEAFVFELDANDRPALAGYRIRGEGHETLFGIPNDALEEGEPGNRQ
jgi:hypothetical protein